MLPLLGFLALRHNLGPADPLAWRRIPSPPRATCEVWLPPSRRPPPILPARAAPERPWASPPKAFPSCASGAPLGVRTLLTLPAIAPNLPEEERAGRSRLQGLVPATSPCCRSTTHEERRTVDAFSGFAPSELPPHPSGPSLVVTMPALSPLGGMTSRPTWTSGLRGANGLAWSVSGLPALLGFGTLQPSRHSVHRCGERAYGFTSRRTPRMTRDTNCGPSSLGNDAATDPRPATRRRRSSVLDWTHRPIVSACLS
jgi:hypothetical protein